MTVLWVVLGAAVGAPLRYAISRGLNRLGAYPWGTWVVNLSGACILGFVTATAAGPVFMWSACAPSSYSQSAVPNSVVAA